MDGYGQQTPDDNTSISIAARVAFSSSLRDRRRRQAGVLQLRWLAKAGTVELFDHQRQTYTGMSRGRGTSRQRPRHLMAGEFTNVNVWPNRVSCVSRSVRSRRTLRDRSSSTPPIRSRCARSRPARRRSRGTPTRPRQRNARVPRLPSQRRSDHARNAAHTRRPRPFWALPAMTWTDDATPASERRLPRSGHRRYATSPILVDAGEGARRPQCRATTSKPCWRANRTVPRSTTPPTERRQPTSSDHARCSCPPPADDRRAGPIAGDGAAVRFAGTNNAAAFTQTFEQPMQTLSVEAWVQASPTATVA